MTTSNDAKTTSSPPTSQPHGKKILPQDNQKYSLPLHRKILSTIPLVVITFIAAGSGLYALKQLHQSVELQISALHNQIVTLQQQQIIEKAEFDTATKALIGSQQTVQNKLSTLNTNLQSALQQQLHQTKDWLLLKARYYLELAQINAHWSEDSATTSALLQQADALLTNIQGQQVFKVRQAIAKDIAQLQATPSTDVTGLLSQLDAAFDAIATLQLKPTMSLSNKKNVVQKNQETASTWRGRLKASMDALDGLIVVRRHDDNILPLSSPAYESMLREGIRLNLQEAQWAVLKDNESVYQFSLTQAIKNIQRSFTPDATDTKALIQQLQTLQQIHLLPQKPSLVEQSLPLLNQLIQSKDTSSTAAGENS